VDTSRHTIPSPTRVESEMPGAKYHAHETERMHELDGAPLASFGRRAVAFVVDLVIGWVLFLALFVVVLLIRRLFVGPLTGPPRDNPVPLNFFGNWYSVLWWVVYFGIATYLWNGRTPGKRLLRIRIVSLVHKRLSLWHSIERALGYGASALELGFGFFQYFVHPNRRTVHDRIAETIVVLDKPFASTSAPSDTGNPLPSVTTQVASDELAAAVRQPEAVEDVDGRG
jgi:uncharacterized RDD family membrane protein YckC